MPLLQVLHLNHNNLSSAVSLQKLEEGRELTSLNLSSNPLPADP